jgi:hypothetical protein
LICVNWRTQPAVSVHGRKGFGCDASRLDAAQQHAQSVGNRLHEAEMTTELPSGTLSRINSLLAAWRIIHQIFQSH